MPLAIFDPQRTRISFLLLLTLGISLLFLGLVQDFLIALLSAAILAALARPFYLWIRSRVGGRENLASAISVLLMLLVVILPMMIFTAILLGEAVGISKSATAWVGQNIREPSALQARLQEIPYLQKLVPYQGEIIAKAGELASKAGSFMAKVLAAGARGTAAFIMSLFIMLYAMFYFLPHGGQWLRQALNNTPLTENDKKRLLSTFTTVTRASLKGSLVIGVVQGTLAGLSFAVAGIQGAVFWGTVMAVLSMLPLVGTALVWIPTVIYLAINGQTVEAIGIGLWCALVVGMVDNVLRPLLIGKDTKMPDLLVLLTTLGGLSMFGAIGVFIGPIIGALFITVWDIWGVATQQEDSTSQAPLALEAKPDSQEQVASD
jgi:predicted PurR-regulated permease PerM